MPIAITDLTLPPDTQASGSANKVVSASAPSTSSHEKKDVFFSSTLEEQTDRMAEKHPSPEAMREESSQDNTVAVPISSEQCEIDVGAEEILLNSPETVTFQYNPESVTETGRVRQQEQRQESEFEPAQDDHQTEELPPDFEITVNSLFWQPALLPEFKTHVAKQATLTTFPVVDSESSSPSLLDATTATVSVVSDPLPHANISGIEPSHHPLMPVDTRKLSKPAANIEQQWQEATPESTHLTDVTAQPELLAAHAADRPVTALATELFSRHPIEPGDLILQSGHAPDISLHRLTTAQLPSASPHNTTWSGVSDRPLDVANDPEWLDDLGHRMIRMMTDDNGIKQARIQLDPPSLGLLDLQLRIEDNKVSVQFYSPSPVVRELISQHIDELRAQINDDEMSLADVDVSSGEQQDAHETSHNQPRKHKQDISQHSKDVIHRDFNSVPPDNPAKQNHDISEHSMLSTYV